MKQYNTYPPSDRTAFNIGKKLNQAVQHHQSGQLDKARVIYEQMLEIDPNHSDALHLLGLIAHQAGDKDAAHDMIAKAIRICPGYSIYHNSLGQVLKDHGSLNEAIGCYKKALEIEPDYAEACFNMGNAYLKLDRNHKAISSFKQVIKIKPDHSASYYNMGEAYHSLELLDKAISCYQNAVQLKPYYTEAYDNMGKTYQDMGMLDKAISCYQKTLDIEPKNADTRFDRSLALLLKGNFQEGWKEYEWRFHRSGWKKTYPYRFDKPRWDGSPFSGKRLFVHAEQGLGDTIQFVRYLPIVKNLGGDVIFEVREPLRRLFQDLPGIDKLVEWSSVKKTDMEFDYYIPLLSIPGLFGTTELTIPPKVPYIYANPTDIDSWQNHLRGPNLKVGLVWAGSPTNTDDRNRSCDLKNFFKLSQIPGVKLYGLQKGEKITQVDELSNGTVVTNFGGKLKDFADTAGLIETLDLLISVDTAAAHLAGAMGKPVWILLPFAPDWRWRLKRKDSPWYPTMRLFRQPSRGNWEAVFQRVVQELRKLLLEVNKIENILCSRTNI